jgi:hypothetical protein
MGISRNTVRAALASDGPSELCALAGRSWDEVELGIRDRLRALPDR